MSRSDTLPIFLDTYKLLIEMYQVTNKFTREYKYSLGQDIKQDTLRLFRCIYSANHHTDKIPYLEDFLSNFELLRLEIRLCHDLNVLPLKKLVHLSLMMDGNAKQANAWKRHEMKKKGLEVKDEETGGEV